MTRSKDQVTTPTHDPPQVTATREWTPVTDLLRADYPTELGAITWSPDGQQLALERLSTTSVETLQFRHADAAATFHPAALIEKSRAPSFVPVTSDMLVVNINRSCMLFRRNAARGPGTSVGRVAPLADISQSVSTWSAGKSRCVAFVTQEGVARIILGSTESSQYSIRDVQRIVASPDGSYLAVGTNDRILLITLADGRVSDLAITHTSGSVLWMTWSPDSLLLCLGHGGGIVECIGIDNHRAVTLEGHTGRIVAADFSHEGAMLATASTDRTVRLWKADDWRCVAVLDVNSEAVSGCLAFHPLRPLLALRGSGTSLRVITYRYDVLSAVEGPATRYRNAKVLLLGDSGVGKSGLAHVLIDRLFVPTASTHGRRVVPLKAELHSGPGGLLEKRETTLWDLAGQPGYRLIHQLHIAQAAVALIVFDARSETDTFAGVRYWSRAVDDAQSSRPVGLPPIRKILVSARIDRGGILASTEQIAAVVKEIGAEAYVETSAKEGWGVEELRVATLAAIPWSELPWASSSALFDDIKQFLVDVGQAGAVMAPERDLDFCSFDVRRTRLM
jgi:GTPase SAR1 family protein